MSDDLGTWMAGDQARTGSPLDMPVCSASIPKPWITFLSGHWTKECPTKPGRYPKVYPGSGPEQYIAFVSEADGILVDNDDLYVRPVGDITYIWWWSEPLPDLPKPPEWA